jgi:hypothetical protein
MLLRLLLGFIFATGTANAATLQYSFHQGGFDEGAFVDGLFAGNDINNDGFLSSWNNEITSFSFSFSGNSLLGKFTNKGVDFYNLYIEYYVTDNIFYGLDIYNVDPLDPYLSYFEYNGYGGRTENHELFTGLIEEGVYYFGGKLFNRTMTLESAEIKNITTNNVPIPFSIYLFVSGLVILMRFNKPIPKIR